MKKILLFMSALAMLAAASCNKVDINEPQTETPSVNEAVESIDFVAYTEVETKTTLNGLATEWEKYDQIDVKGVGYITDEEGSKVTFLKSDEEDENPEAPYYAAYPYALANYYDDDCRYAIYMMNELYLEANDIGDYVPAVAYSESEPSLHFQNVASLVKFQVPATDEPVTEIHISATEELAGEIFVDQTGEVPTWYADPDFTTYTELILTTNVSFAPEATYYVPVLPGKKTNFTVTINETVVATGIAIEFKRNVIHNIGTLPSSEVRKVYLKPGVWTSDNAWFAAHFFGAADVDTKMEDPDGDGIYEATVPNGATGVIFCRMNPKFTEFEWNKDGEEEQHVWNQTEDLTVPGKDDDKLCYVVSGWDIPGEWKTYDDATAVPEVDASAYGVVGSFQGWNPDAATAMEYVSDNWIVTRGVELYKSDEFKFVKDKSWDVSYGTSSVAVLEESVETVVVINGQNMRVSKNGKYNLYLNPNDMKVKAECVEEYTDLTVDLVIDNKANWSPLYITLKDGDNVIAENATVTNNKYQISGDYIGSTLTCTLSNGDKTSDVMNVAITKTGATVTLEETIVKLYFQLDTENAKQWWGNTAKIHVWNTGTSFDTSWPGNTMTSEGNYTWSIIVPSELVGKTINYLVHNGNGWQSKDSSVTIKAEGNTVTGSSIGIN